MDRKSEDDCHGDPRKAADVILPYVKGNDPGSGEMMVELIAYQYYGQSPPRGSRNLDQTFDELAWESRI